MLQVYPHGSTDSLPYCTMGSGSLNAMAVFEASYEEDMTQEQAEALVARAIRSGGWPCGAPPCVQLAEAVLQQNKSGVKPPPTRYGRLSGSWWRQHYGSKLASSVWHVGSSGLLH